MVSSRKVTRSDTTPGPRNLSAGPLLILTIPGVRIPSRNETNKGHWSVRNAIRRAWSVLLARSLSGLSGSVAGCWTMTISAEAARSCAMQSLPRSAARMILPADKSDGITSSARSDQSMENSAARASSSKSGRTNELAPNDKVR